jgi:hypothetical protein
MKIIKNLTFAALTALAALAVTLLFQIPTTLADNHRQKGDDNERGDHHQQINNRFVILLAGVYEPVPLGHGPKDNLGLLLPHLNNGKYQTVPIYHIAGGASGHKDEDKAIGTFYVLGGEGMCAYDLPGGSLTAKFTRTNDVTTAYEESVNGWAEDMTIQLVILEATGIYEAFVGGYVHMVDILKFRAADAALIEDCFCHIHPKLVAP